MMTQTPHYAGFWIRFIATWIDAILFTLIITPILWYFYGAQYFLNAQQQNDFLSFTLNFILPAVATVIFWYYKAATPGKLMLHLEIVDADSLAKPTLRQSIIRYVSYFISMLPLGLGFLWIAIDPQKQAWHDKIAHTFVIKKDKQASSNEKK